jgi:putative membrane protein
MDQQKTDQIFAIQRPHPNLMKLYVIRALLTGPGIIFMLPLLYFRYHTLRYRFDEEGVHMRWGILFRQEVNLTYARIQDIHLVSGVLQRWFGLADLRIQTASGSGAAEMTVEGLLEYEQVRDFLYTRMRGYRDAATQPQKIMASDTEPGAAPGREELLAVDLLHQIRDEIRGARMALEGSSRGREATDV